MPSKINNFITQNWKFCQTFNFGGVLKGGMTLVFVFLRLEKVFRLDIIKLNDHLKMHPNVSTVVTCLVSLTLVQWNIQPLKNL